MAKNHVQRLGKKRGCLFLGGLRYQKCQYPGAPLWHGPCTFVPPAVSASVTRGAVKLPSFYTTLLSLYTTSISTWQYQHGAPCWYRCGSGRCHIGTRPAPLNTCRANCSACKLPNEIRCSQCLCIHVANRYMGCATRKRLGTKFLVASAT